MMAVVVAGPLAEGLVLLALGAVFGFWLERGGLGDARKLAGQFYFTDFTVLQAMLTAIVTCALGLFWATRLGLTEVADLAFAPTYIGPQLVGGLVFGAGFVLAGLCPGTACVAAATGRHDGLLVATGVVGGTLAYAGLVPRLGGLPFVGGIGRITLPELAGVDRGVAVLVLFGLAVGVLAAVSRWHGVAKELPRRPLVVGAVLAVAAAFVGDPGDRPPPFAEFRTGVAVPGAGATFLDPEDLAGWLRSRRSGLVVLDARPGSVFDAYHVPGAVRAASPTAPGTVVVYAEDETIPTDQLAGLRAAGATDVFVLAGGMRGWVDRVLFPDFSRVRNLERSEIGRLAALSRYFGGRPTLLPEQSPGTPPGYVRQGC